MNDERPGDERWRDPIVEEVRAARQALFAAAGDDIFEFCRRLREEQASSGNPVVNLARPSNRAEPGEAA
jgi:hypothetical protein